MYVLYKPQPDIREERGAAQGQRVVTLNQQSYGIMV